jgi:hypothetical protein
VLATALTNRLDYYDAVLGDPGTRDAALSAFQDSFVFAGALSILGIIACFLIDDKKAAAAATAPAMEPEFAMADVAAAAHTHGVKDGRCKARGYNPRAFLHADRP